MVLGRFALLRDVVPRPTPHRCAETAKVMKCREQVLILGQPADVPLAGSQTDIF